ncbi:hypothetical protein PAEVO_43480 [Paenibacillus sp. GM2FR]|nr:hypothetical protein PAEVO_43480 [Paenibacillus sp. GM2FR]
MVLFDLVKQWYWYDWLMFIIRLIFSISLAFTTIGLQQYFTLPIVVLVLWQLIAFSVPWFCLQLDYKYYMFTEIVISGGLCLYLASFFPQAYLAFLLYAFFIAAHSAQRAYLWSGPISILLLPAIIKQLAEQSNTGSWPFTSGWHISSDSPSIYSCSIIVKAKRSVSKMRCWSSTCPKSSVLRLPKSVAGCPKSFMIPSVMPTLRSLWDWKRCVLRWQRIQEQAVQKAREQCFYIAALWTRTVKFQAPAALMLGHPFSKSQKIIEGDYRFGEVPFLHMNIEQIYEATKRPRHCNCILL